MLLGRFAWLSISVSYWDWYGFPASFIAAEAIDQLGGWLFGGLALAAIAKSSTSRAVDRRPLSRSFFAPAVELGPTFRLSQIPAAVICPRIYQFKEVMIAPDGAALGSSFAMATVVSTLPTSRSTAPFHGPGAPAGSAPVVD